MLSKHLAESRVANFTFQEPFGRFFLDLASREHRVAVEIDGKHHSGRTKEDDARTAYLEARYWIVKRYWAADVRKASRKISTEIEEIVESRAAQLESVDRKKPRKEKRLDSFSSDE